MVIGDIGIQVDEIRDFDIRVNKIQDFNIQVKDIRNFTIRGDQIWYFGPLQLQLTSPLFKLSITSSSRSNSP